MNKKPPEIPTFECHNGCTDCCGPVPWTLTEFARVSGRPDLASATLDASMPGHIITTSPTHKCPFATRKGCSVYEDRPLVCRLFGAVDDPLMRCPHGCRPRHLLTQRQGSDLVQASIRREMQR